MLPVASATHRAVITEYGSSTHIVPDLAAAMSMSNEAVEGLVLRRGEAIRRRHGLKENPLSLGRDGFRSKGIAGIVSLSSTVDLEIRPKFAGPGDDWRGDLIYLALSSASGRLDFNSSVAAQTSSTASLADLVARVILNTIQRNHRHPLRLRRREAFQSFEIQDEIDPEAFFNPGEDGWLQQRYVMTWDNEFWATLRAGMLVLETSVRDVYLISKLREVASRWGTTTALPSRRRRILPPRLIQWQTAYDICFDILQGSSMSPGSGRFQSFEFTLDMWRVWETLVSRSLVATFGADKVALQKDIHLGTLQRATYGGPIMVRPDAILTGPPPTVVDAKYKGRWDRDAEPISAADRYEAMAFMEASGSDQAILLYPDLAGRNVSDPPRIVQQERVPQGRITAVSIGLSGISAPGGRKRFASGICDAIDNITSLAFA